MNTNQISLSFQAEVHWYHNLKSLKQDRSVKSILRVKFLTQMSYKERYYQGTIIRPDIAYCYRIIEVKKFIFQFYHNEILLLYLT